MGRDVGKPGWYPDPSGVGQEIFWDGSSWTGEVRAGAVENSSARPAPVDSWQTPAAAPPGWYADPQLPQQFRYWDGIVWTDQRKLSPLAVRPASDAITSTGGSTATRSGNPTRSNIRVYIIGAVIALVLIYVFSASAALRGSGENAAPLAVSSSQSDIGGEGSGGGGDETTAEVGGGPRQMQGIWDVRMDAERTVKVELAGSFNVYEDKSEAEAGETNIMVETFGTITTTNISDGRNTDDMGTGLELFVPIASCPDWEETSDGRVGTHCSRTLLSFDIPNLEAGATAEIDISGTESVASVNTDSAQLIIDSMLGESAAVVSADRVFWNDELEKLNPTCTADSNLTWVTYFTEDASVTACSTELGGKAS